MNKELTQLLLDVADHLDMSEGLFEHPGRQELLDRVQAALNGELKVNGCAVCSQWEKEYHKLEEKMKKNRDEYVAEVEKIKTDQGEAADRIDKIVSLTRDSMFGNRKDRLKRIERVATGKDYDYGALSDTWY